MLTAFLWASAKLLGFIVVERERERGARGRARGMKESYSVQVLVRD